MESSKTKNILIITFLIILLLPTVEAVGISYTGKGTKRVDFEPGKEIKFPYAAQITRQDISEYYFHAFPDTETGYDISKHIFFDPPQLSNIDMRKIANSKGQAFVPFSVILKMPEEIPVPGVHRAGFTITEVPPNVGGVTAVAAVKLFIEVRVLYPGIKAYYKVKAPNVNENEKAEIRVEVENWGIKPLKSVRAQIDIKNLENETIATVYTDDITIESGKMGTLKGILDTTGLKTGMFKAVAKIFYDGETGTTEDEFFIGTMVLDVINHTKNITKDMINPFAINIKSNWNNPLKNVFADVWIQDKKFTSAPIRMDPLGKAKLELYIDAQGFKPGVSPIEILLNYDSFESRTKSEVLVLKENIKKYFVSTTSLFLIAVIIILLSVNIVFLKHWKKSQKEETK